MATVYAGLYGTQLLKADFVKFSSGTHLWDSIHRPS